VTRRRRPQAPWSLLLALLLTSSLAADVACARSPSPLAPTATAAAAPTTSPAPLAAAPPPSVPDRDLYDLARRYRGAAAAPSGPRTAAPTVAGSRATFNVLDVERTSRFEVTATARLTSDHLVFYVADGVAVSDDALARSARQFEERTYPRLIEAFGEPREPGLNGDPRYTVLLAPIAGVAGYYAAGDEYPSAVYPFSNERHMVYLSTGSIQPGTTAFDAVLAHEFQHALHWQADRTEESWLNEGLSELASYLAGYPPNAAEAYLSTPDVPLLIWPSQPGAAGTHYGGSYLLFRYLLAQGVTPAELLPLVADPANGRTSLERLLSSLRPPRTFDALFGDWLVATVVNLREGPLGYAGFSLRAPKVTPLTLGGGAFRGSVAPYGADYLELGGAGDVTVTFQGRTETTALPTEAPGGRSFWWSQRGDGTNPRLTRAFDLTSLQRATLSFKLWYDLEDGWDYGYVAASTDGGNAWQPLAGPHTTTNDPLRLAYGAGYTGHSGGGATSRWLDERVDLTPYAGKRILLRFEVVTDDGVHRPGFAVDDISVAELAFADGAEADEAGWTVEGFWRTDNRLPARPLVRLIEEGSDTTVRDMLIGPEGVGSLTVRGLGSTTRRALLVVSALAPLASEQLPYEVRLALPP